jgi:hypothetical protein
MERVGGCDADANQVYCLPLLHASEYERSVEHVYVPVYLFERVAAEPGLNLSHALLHTRALNLSAMST